MVYSQSADFRFDTTVCQECDNYAKSVIRSSSFWLSESPAVDPMSKNRIMIQSGVSSVVTKIGKQYLTYPNFDIAIKATNNLALTGKVFGFSVEKESPQILGAGIQYYFGGKDTLDWATSIQRVDLKGLNHFRLTSLTIDIRKWVEWRMFQFRIGAGSNFFKEQSYSGNHTAPTNMEGQINFVGMDAFISYSFAKFGFGTRINSDSSFITCFIQKEIF